MPDILLLDGARTPFTLWPKGERPGGLRGGQLAALDHFDLGAAALKGALDRSKLASEKLSRIVFGNCYHVTPHACYGARYLANRVGAPPSVTGVAVTLACGSGLQAIATAAGEIALGASLVAAVGADSSSNVPRNVFVPSFKDASCGINIAETSQTLSKEFGFTRADQDRWALLSHQRARKAQLAGRFAEEIVETAGVKEDDAVLPEPTAEHFENSKLLYETGDATNGNTHAIVDGGSALILASEKGAAGLKPLGRLLGTAVAGVAPERMAYGSVAAIRMLLDALKMKTTDFDLFEINETFASQIIIGVKELSLPEDRVNPQGGALALGHPFGGTGPRLVLTLLRQLKRAGLKRGIASICVGGGLGIAAAVELV
jgi:acetyl-CoA acetyltransferase family protein